MIAIAVDDEELMLRALVRAISASPDIKEVVNALVALISSTCNAFTCSV